MKETLEEKIQRLNSESTSLAVYNPRYPELFEVEKNFLMENSPKGLIKRIEHFGSTAIPNIRSKPIIDLLVEVSSLNEVKDKYSTELEKLGYDYLWRPTIGMQPPWYAWFIKRDETGKRTHHIHMIEGNFQMWQRLLFRDYLCEFPKEAQKYDQVKTEASEKFSNDRGAYTEAKTEIVKELTDKAKKYYKL